MGGGRAGQGGRGSRPGPRRAAADAVLWPKTRRVLTVLLAEMESETEDPPALRLPNQLRGVPYTRYQLRSSSCNGVAK